MTRTKITREGKRFAIASSLIAVAALNTGNNLIYLILSLMFSLLIISMALGRINLSGLSLEVTCPQTVFAGDEASVTLLIRNSKRRLPSYSVKCSLSDHPAAAYFQLIPPSLMGVNELIVKFGRRGLYKYGDFGVSSGFPFILFDTQSKIKVESSVLVYPALIDVGAVTDKLTGTEMSEVVSMSGLGDDIYSLREFREGDDWRRIHWKASAKRGVYFVREYAEYRGAKVTIVLDNSIKEGGELFERAVSMTASVAKNYLEQGCFVRVVSCRETVPFGSGEEHFFNIMDFLATVAEEDEWDNSAGGAVDGYIVTVRKTRGVRPGAYHGEGVEVVYAEDI